MRTVHNDKSQANAAAFQNPEQAGKADVDSNSTGIASSTTRPEPAAILRGLPGQVLPPVNVGDNVRVLRAVPIIKAAGPVKTYGLFNVLPSELLQHIARFIRIGAIDSCFHR